MDASVRAEYLDLEVHRKIILPQILFFIKKNTFTFPKFQVVRMLQSCKELQFRVYKRS